MITLDSAKLYLRVDSTYDDSLIQSCISAAQAHLEAAIDDYDTIYAKDTGFAALADATEYAIITEMYNNRDAHNDNRQPLSYIRQPLSYIVRAMITQLQNYPTTGGDADD